MDIKVIFCGQNTATAAAEAGGNVPDVVTGGHWTGN